MEIVSTQPAAIKEATIRFCQTDIQALQFLLVYVSVTGSHPMAMSLHDFRTKINSLPVGTHWGDMSFSVTAVKGIDVPHDGLNVRINK